MSSSLYRCSRSTPRLLTSRQIASYRSGAAKVPVSIIVLTLYGNSEHVAHICIELSKCLKQILFLSELGFRTSGNISLSKIMIVF